MTRTGYLAAVIAVLVCCTSVTAAVLVFNPSGAYTTKQSIGAARTATDAAGKEVVITTPYVLTVATVWPADRALRIAAGGSIAFSGGGSLSIPNGPTFSGTTKLLEGFTTKPFAPRIEHFYNVSTSRGRTFTQLSTAKRALGTNKATLEFSTPQGASSITVPSNIELIPRNGALITVDTGKVLTYAGSTTNWPTAVPIFAGAGTVTLAADQPSYAVWGGGLWGKGSGGSLIGTRVLTTGTTYTPTAGTTSIFIEMVGGGAAGGGVTCSAGNAAAGGGGGAGSYNAAYIIGITNTTYTYAIGAGGAAGAAGAAGGAGGATTFTGPGAVTVQAGSWNGAAAMATGSTVLTATGSNSESATNANGLFEFTKNVAPSGSRTSATLVLTGAGGCSRFGECYSPFWANATQHTNSGNQAAAKGYGTGGYGAYCFSGTTSYSGGAGAPGVIIVYEYR